MGDHYCSTVNKVELNFSLIILGAGQRNVIQKVLHPIKIGQFT